MDDDVLYGFVVPCAVLGLCLLWPLVTCLCRRKRLGKACDLSEARAAELAGLLNGRWKLKRNGNDYSGPARYRPKDARRRRLPNFTNVICNPSRAGQGQLPLGTIDFILTGYNVKEFRGRMTLKEYSDGSFQFNRNGSRLHFDGDDRVVFQNRGSHSKVWDGVWERIGEYHRVVPRLSEQGPPSDAEHLPSPLATPIITPRVSTAVARRLSELDVEAATNDPAVALRQPRKSVVGFADVGQPGGEGPGPGPGPRLAGAKPRPLSDSEERDIRTAARRAARDPVKIRDYRNMVLEHAEAEGYTREAYSAALTDDVIAAEIEKYTLNYEREKRLAMSAQEAEARRGRYMSVESPSDGEYISPDAAPSVPSHSSISNGGGGGPWQKNGATPTHSFVNVLSMATGISETAEAPAFDSARYDADSHYQHAILDMGSGDGGMQQSARASFGEIPMLGEARTLLGEDGGASRLRRPSEMSLLGPSNTKEYVGKAEEASRGQRKTQDMGDLWMQHLTKSGDVSALEVSLDKAKRVRTALDQSCAALEGSGVPIPPELERQRGDATAAVAEARQKLATARQSDDMVGLQTAADEARRVNMALQTSCMVLQNQGVPVPEALQIQLVDASAASAQAEHALLKAKAATTTSMFLENPPPYIRSVPGMWAEVAGVPVQSRPRQQHTYQQKEKEEQHLRRQQPRGHTDEEPEETEEETEAMRRIREAVVRHTALPTYIQPPEFVLAGNEPLQRRTSQI